MMMKQYMVQVVNNALMRTEGGEKIVLLSSLIWHSQDRLIYVL